MSLAIARAYSVAIRPGEIGAEFATRDVRDYVSKTAGRPHPDLSVAKVAALTLSRAARVTGDEALASVVADLIDGGISLDRQAAAPRGLADPMARHRATRARDNPLDSDLKARARRDAPSVIRRSGEDAARKTAAPPPSAARAAAGSRVRYRHIDDGTEHEVFVGAPAGPAGEIRIVPMGSPVAKALLGTTRGTILSLSVGGRAIEIEVVAVD